MVYFFLKKKGRCDSQISNMCVHEKTPIMKRYPVVLLAVIKIQITENDQCKSNGQVKDLLLVEACMDTRKISRLTETTN